MQLAVAAMVQQRLQMISWVVLWCALAAVPHTAARNTLPMPALQLKGPQLHQASMGSKARTATTKTKQHKQAATKLHSLHSHQPSAKAKASSKHSKKNSPAQPSQRKAKPPSKSKKSSRKPIELKAPSKAKAPVKAAAKHKTSPKALTKTHIAGKQGPSSAHSPPPPVKSTAATLPAGAEEYTGAPPSTHIGPNWPHL